MNPDMSFAGVMPLHLACECGHVDLVAYLLHWGASRTRLDGSRLTALQVAERRKKDPKTKGQAEVNDTLVKLLSDEKYLKSYVEELLPRIDTLRVEQRATVRAARLLFAKQLAFFSLLSIILVHILVLYFPDAAAKRLSPKALARIWDASPLLDAAKHAAWLAARGDAPGLSHEEL